MSDRVSANVLVSEVACRGAGCCGGSFPVHTAILDAFEELREWSGGRSLRISSGFRCRSYALVLKARGYATEVTSQHCLGRALDVHDNEYVTPEELRAIARTIGQIRGLILYDWGIHIDCRRTHDGERFERDFRSEKRKRQLAANGTDLTEIANEAE